jgi:hypothetical protein
MDVFVDFIWEIIVDDMHDVFNIETSGSNVRRNKDWSFTIAESNHCVLMLEGIQKGYLAFALGAIAVDRGTWKLEIVEIIVQTVACAFGFDKNQGACRRLFEEKIHQTLFLVIVLDRNNLYISHSARESTR